MEDRCGRWSDEPRGEGNRVSASERGEEAGAPGRLLKPPSRYAVISNGASLLSFFAVSRLLTPARHPPATLPFAGPGCGSGGVTVAGGPFSDCFSGLCPLVR